MLLYLILDFKNMPITVALSLFTAGIGGESGKSDHITARSGKGTVKKEFLLSVILRGV